MCGYAYTQVLKYVYVCVCVCVCVCVYVYIYVKIHMWICIHSSTEIVIRRIQCSTVYIQFYGLHTILCVPAVYDSMSSSAAYDSMNT